MDFIAALYSRLLRFGLFMKHSLLLSLCLAASAQAQPDFHAYTGTEDLIEGGRVEKLTAVYYDLRFNVRAPVGWYRQLDEASSKIIFVSPSGKSALTVQFTTNSPGTLPDEDLLRYKAQQAHPGADLLQTAVCPTSYRPGV